MGKSTSNLPLLTALWLMCMAVSAGTAPALSAAKSARGSVIKIYVTAQREDYSLPWQSGRPASGTGTGFIIGKRRILTNAHVVSNARFLQVQKDGDPRRFRATVNFIGHDCDLAILTVDDPLFFKGIGTIKFAKTLPKLNDEVTVLGYPMGGTRLSVTKGVVSRIDYSIYSHSGIDQHLVLQVDAAVNPGNSGGPVMFKNKVVGLVFQGIAWAENIGYAIPVPVIRHFLEDINDGVYHGYPELGVAFMETRNTALRQDLKLPDDKTGVVVYYVDPFGGAKDHLCPRDVLLSIDDYPIANDGTIELAGNNVIFQELLERKQWGDSAILGVWREGNETEITVPLTNPRDPFVYRNLYDRRPEYYIAGGLVFSPLNREYLRTLRRNAPGINIQQLFYYSNYAKIDGLYKDRDEFVVLIRRLPHPVNTYADDFVNGIVTQVNGLHIRNLKDVKKAISNLKNGFHVIQFAGTDESLVLDADAVSRADPEIFSRYGMSSPEYMEME